MSLAQLQINNLRNIEAARLNLHPKLNFFIGENGSGKTSLLEAVYLLGSGHSFRTREISPLISNGKDSLTIFARKGDEQTVSIQKSLTTPAQVRVNSFPCQTSSELARFLPCQVFYQDIFQIIDAGPAVRRTVLDWGLFHVKQNYHALWKNYKRALKQRNSLLKQRASQQQLRPWNKVLVELATQMHEARKEYFACLLPEFHLILQQLSTVDCSLAYYKGWDKKGAAKPLELILEDSYQSDISRQFTQYGAHQADLIFTINNLNAKQYLSRGQQKIILFALKLAQARLNKTSCLYLCDDLTSELDEAHTKRLLNLIGTMDGQFFITSVDESLLRNNQGQSTFFSMHHGEVVELPGSQSLAQA
ncbi:MULTISPECIES: DNA replication/repair protein RecF [unclassified Legionella]|uniref:DNA replication/repair protein RecF n=1 Tax=unclassified Legionella TaxID=2622702 RepID=UPI001055EEB7|nr:MULTISPECIES: DNA replication/repair protein RecF [unclassified Legionella]MDI9817986.1 DNA replication/repair protein RecF [Legionella sp. PL877]